MSTYALERAKIKVLQSELAKAEERADTTRVFDIHCDLRKSRQKIQGLLARMS